MHARVEAGAGLCRIWQTDWERDSRVDVRSFGRSGAANNGADSPGRLRCGWNRRNARGERAVIGGNAGDAGKSFDDGGFRKDDSAGEAIQWWRGRRDQEARIAVERDSTGRTSGISLYGEAAAEWRGVSGRGGF